MIQMQIMFNGHKVIINAESISYEEGDNKMLITGLTQKSVNTAIENLTAPDIKTAKQEDMKRNN